MALAVDMRALFAGPDAVLAHPAEASPFGRLTSRRKRFGTAGIGGLTRVGFRVDAVTHTT